MHGFYNACVQVCLFLFALFVRRARIAAAFLI